MSTDMGGLCMTYKSNQAGNIQLWSGTDASTILVIDDAFSPLAAGFAAGTEVTYTAKRDSPRWIRPTAQATGAIKVAHIKTALLGPVYPHHVGILAYDTGEMMEKGLVAPARRVLLPFGDGASLGAGTDALTTDGWALFDAAVNWAATTAPTATPTPTATPSGVNMSTFELD